jgi:hypothetical protein
MPGVRLLGRLAARTRRRSEKTFSGPPPVEVERAEVWRRAREGRAGRCDVLWPQPVNGRTDRAVAGISTEARLM